MMISEIVKKRLEENNIRYFACDSVADWINLEEIDLLIEELTQKFESVLDTLLIDRIKDPNSKETAKRLARMYINETMSGRYAVKPDITAFPNDSHYSGMIVVKCEVKSLCSHHHQPVNGIAFIGIIPSNKVLGLSKYSRLVEYYSRRGTLQEQLTKDICNALVQECNTDDVAVHIIAKHGCCENRGINTADSSTQTTILSGEFEQPGVKAEFFEHIKLQVSKIL
jgi:GTP cyclohydrolase IA